MVILMSTIHKLNLPDHTIKRIDSLVRLGELSIQWLHVIVCSLQMQRASIQKWGHISTAHQSLGIHSCAAALCVILMRS
jgi:hypothetical protein